MKKTILGASLLAIVGFTTVGTVEAQWSVVEVNSTSIRTTLDQVKEGIVATIGELQGVRQNQDAQVRQTDQYQDDTDKRNRLAYGMQESIRRDLNAMPTIEQCVEITGRAGNSGGVQASLYGGGAGSRSTQGTKEYAQSKIVSTATAQANVLQNVISGQTCAGGMDAGINGCGTGPMPYAGADVNAASLKRDFASRNSNGIMTNSLNATAVKAAEVYAQNATLYGAPPEVELDKIRKNPSYVSVYKPVIAKLNASYEALMDVVNLRRAPLMVPSNIVGQKWNKDKADYKATFGVDAPAIPSFFEALNFAVMRDYAGPEQQEVTDPILLAQELNQKMVISNVIALQQFKATETTNVLLAHLLTQAVAPTNIENVKAEAAKTRNLN